MARSESDRKSDRRMDGPLQLSPVFKPKIWGRLDLGPIFEPVETTPRGHSRPRSSTDRPPGGTLIGEVWVTDDKSKFLNGPLAGMTLAEAAKGYGPELCGRRWSEPRFPILAKYLFTSDWLSVQVHPDDQQARTHDPGNTGKTEMWYVVGRDKGAEILLGMNPGTSTEALRAACAEGKGKDLLHAFHPHAGEAIFVPPGTVHALGPGLVLFEVEQNSDLTYRLDDFGRRGLDGKPRLLHWEKAMSVIQSDRKPLRNLPLLKFREPYGERRYVLACRHFAVEELTVKRLAHLAGNPERVEILSLLAGEGRFETEAGWLGSKTGETWLIPPATRAYRLVPHEEIRLLKFYVPDLETDFRQPLKRHGIPAGEIAKVIFE
jgi:mannose-6-phosphate isomerase